MTFNELAQRFDQTNSGTDAFKFFYRDAFALMKGDRDNAGIYFLAGVAAQSFVRTYEDQGITTEFADAAKATMSALNAKLLTALASEPAQRLKLLGEAACDYQLDVHDF